MSARIVGESIARRAWLLGGLGVGSSLVLGCTSDRQRHIASQWQPPTGAARPPAGPTRSPNFASAQSSAEQCARAATSKDIEGPFFKAGAPEGSQLGSDSYGVPFVLRGCVTAIDCRPLSHATLEIWQADNAGRYDNEGFRFRTKVVTDASGAFALRSIVPGHYKNGDQFRPAHVHVKVHHASHPTLTTQLYFEGDPYNAVDPWFDGSRALKLDNQAEGRTARFDFVLG